MLRAVGGPAVASRPCVASDQPPPRDPTAWDRPAVGKRVDDDGTAGADSCSGERRVEAVRGRAITRTKDEGCGDRGSRVHSLPPRLIAAGGGRVELLRRLAGSPSSSSSSQPNASAMPRQWPRSQDGGFSQPGVRCESPDARGLALDVGRASEGWRSATVRRHSQEARPRGEVRDSNDLFNRRHRPPVNSRRQLIAELSKLDVRAAAQNRGADPLSPMRQSGTECGGCPQAAVACSQPGGNDDADNDRSDDGLHPHRQRLVSSPLQSPAPAGGGGRELSATRDDESTAAGVAAAASTCSVSCLHEVAAAAFATYSTHIVVAEGGDSPRHVNPGVAAPPSPRRVSR